jgi:hypothetical protein
MDVVDGVNRFEVQLFRKHRLGPFAHPFVAIDERAWSEMTSPQYVASFDSVILLRC